MPQFWVDFAGVFYFSGVAGITAAFERTLDRVAEDQTRAPCAALFKLDFS